MEPLRNHDMNDLYEMNYIVSAVIMNETMRLNRLFDAGKNILLENVDSFKIEDYRKAFEGYNNDFLSEELLNKVLANFMRYKYSLKEFFPEGVKVVVGAFPCNINGTIFTEEEMKEGKYLTNLFVEDEETGLSLGFGALRPSTYANMLPQEIQNMCSFKAHYDSDPKNQSTTEKDFEKFAEQYRNAYHELRKLLKPGN
jgi:hypothetical protein